MVLVALVVVVAVGGAVALGGAGLLGSARRRLLLLPAVVVGGLVLLMGAGFVTVGLRGGSPEHEHEPEAAAPAPAPVEVTPATVPPGPVTTRSRPQPHAAGADLPLVVVAATGDDRVAAYPVIGGLPPQGVVRIVARGFHEFEPGGVAQCVLVPGAEVVCAPASKVQFDGSGRADFHLAVSEGVDGDRCRAGRPTCLLRVTGSDSGRQATAQTVFVDDALPVAVTLGPATASGRDLRVAVTVRGLAAGTRGVAVVCIPPEAYDARRCAGGGPAAAFVAGGDGAAAATVELGEVGRGSARHRCGHRHPCAVSVFVGDGHLTASAVPIRFPAGVAASYDPGRLALGLALALALALAAVLLAGTTDWTKPTEAGAPALERADLQTAASLDELFGTDAELEARDPIPG